MYKLYYLTSELDDMLPRYIGYTSKTLQERLKNHVRDCNRKKVNTHKKNWIKKVISSGFEVEIFLITEVDTLEEILLIERAHIEPLFDYLVNSTNGGETSKVFSDDVRKKISQSLKEYFRTHKHYNIGRTYSLSDEHKEKIRLSHIGIKNHFYGKNHTEESKIKMGIKNSKYKQFTYDDLYDLYIVEGYVTTEIAKKFNSTIKSIGTQLRKFGLTNLKKDKYMKKNKLIINVVVGYMLKVLRNGLDITIFKNEFSAIRHGDYDTFISLINVKEPSMVVNNAGVIKTNNFSKSSGDCDFCMLLASEPSLTEFFKKCKNHYDIVYDNEISDEIYEKLVEFEISLRMHSGNNGINERNLVDVINKLCDFKSFDETIRKRLHNGRNYINYVKHPNNKFQSHADGIIQFNDAFSCLIENDLQLKF